MRKSCRALAFRCRICFRVSLGATQLPPSSKPSAIWSAPDLRDAPSGGPLAAVRDLPGGALPGLVGSQLDFDALRSHHLGMRTTLTLDPEVSQRIEQEAREKGMSLDSVVNEVLRAGFGLAGDRQVRQPFRVQ